MILRTAAARPFCRPRWVANVATKSPDYSELYSRASAPETKDFTIGLRRQMHENPELMYQEHATSALVQSTLDKLEVPYTKGWGINTRPERYDGPGGTGVVAEIGDGQAPCVLLRADMDALPILEAAPVDFASQVPGKMHACGHDAHTAMLLGAAKLLQGMKTRGELPPGTVRLMFQPAEEGGAGCKRMVEEGVLSRQPAAQRAFGFHLWPTLPSGEIGGRAGAIMAASDKFDIKVRGVGGHAAMPHLAKDPVVCASALVTALQTLVSRNTSPLEAAVASVTKLQAATNAYNVIPAHVYLGGTLRCLCPEGLARLRQRAEAVARGVAAAHDCAIDDITFAPDPYLPTINDPALWRDFVAPLVASAATSGAATEVEPCLAGEDFSFLAAEVPSAFLWLGQGGRPTSDSTTSNTEPLDTALSLHHPRFAVDESVLPTGVALHAHLATMSLQDLSTAR